MLKIYNSLTGEKTEFKPLVPGKIGIYVCGNTMYDYCHIGHARSMILFDVIVNYLREFYEVTYIRNITDIDDKIIKRALENNESIDTLTRRFIDFQHEDERALGLNAPDYEPRATQYVPQMLALIEKLLERGYAYTASDGDICFDVRRFKNYGQLSGHDIEKLKTGVRIELNDTKRDPLDFVLWKISKPGEPHWASPWGEGRPGWHIECAAMSTDLLGQPFDIHGGGMDLKFPHHENEITESEAACDKPFARWWMHVGLLQIEGEKMSKSLNNFLTIRDALEKYHPEELRFFMMKSLYRRPADYSESNLHETKTLLRKYYEAILGLPEPSKDAPDTPEARSAREKFNACMDDDFNTTAALTHLGEICSKIHLLKQSQETLNEAMILAQTVRRIGKILGILRHPPEDFLKGARSIEQDQLIQSLEKKIDQLRSEKNWSEADKIRQQLINMGLEVKTTPSGTHAFRKFS